MQHLHLLSHCLHALSSFLNCVQYLRSSVLEAAHRADLCDSKSVLRWVLLDCLQPLRQIYRLPVDLQGHVLSDELFLVCRELVYLVVEACSESVVFCARCDHLLEVFDQDPSLLLMSDFFMSHEGETALRSWEELLLLAWLEAWLSLRLAPRAGLARLDHWLYTTSGTEPSFSLRHTECAELARLGQLLDLSGTE